jgi:hypothetical protein
MVIFLFNFVFIKAPTPCSEENKNIIRWMVDAQYKKDQVMN